MTHLIGKDRVRLLFFRGRHSPDRDPPKETGGRCVRCRRIWVPVGKRCPAIGLRDASAAGVARAGRCQRGWCNDAWREPPVLVVPDLRPWRSGGLSLRRIVRVMLSLNSVGISNLYCAGARLLAFGLARCSCGGVAGIGL
jgi:hypothetical protein